MAKFTNYTSGPKGLNAVSGLVMVEPGQTVEAELSDAEAKSAKATGWFTKPAGAEAPADGDKKGDNAPDKKA